MLIERVEVTPRALTMRVGEWNYDLKATVYPSNTVCKNVRWVSSAPSAVSVNESSGYLYAHSGGDVVITAIVNDDLGNEHYGYCDIYVDDAYNDENPSIECPAPDSGYDGGSGSNECICPQVLVESITLTPTYNNTMHGGDFYTISAWVRPANATNKTLHWESDNEEIVYVDQNGCVEARKIGTTTVWACATDGSGVVASCEINVRTGTEKVQSVSISPSHKEIDEYDKGYFFDAQVSPSDARNTGVVWYTNNEYVLDVSYLDGKITAKRPGTAIVYAVSEENSDIYAEATVMVRDDPSKNWDTDFPQKEEKEEVPSTNMQSYKPPESEQSDPVDVYSGAQLLDLALLQLFDGRKMAVKAHYRSDCLVEGMMGVGWYHDFEKHLKHDKCSIKLYNMPGSYTNYDSSDCIHYTSSRPEKLGFVLTYTQGAQYPYCLDCNSKRKEYYDSVGRLAKIVDHQGYTIKIAYCSNAIVLTDESVNKSITLEFGENGKISRILDDVGRIATLEYDEKDHMIRFCDTEGHPLSYTYDGAGRVLTGTDSMGTVFVAYAPFVFLTFCL